VLGLKADATLDQVKEAYRSLALKHHPKNDSSAEAEAKFAEVAKAYETIIDSKKNRGYEDFGFGSFFEDFEK
jgi:DnaJ-class molecular chaperone